MNKKTNGARRKSTPKKIDFQITEELIAYGVKILTKLDSSINNSKDLAKKEKDNVVTQANNLVEYLAGFGTITTTDQLEMIKNALYDQLNWRRLGGETGSNKGRVKGNPTITKYFSILKGYIELKGRLNTSLDFAEIRTIYQDRGNRKTQRTFTYNLSRSIRPITESISSKKQANEFAKEFQSFINDFAKKHNINLES